jgi:hypothetical protein
MANAFDIACEMARLVFDDGRPTAQVAAEIRSKFPVATEEDVRRAVAILDERAQMSLEEQREGGSAAR